MPAGPMKKISIGRADLMVPEDAIVTMTAEVNDIKVTTIELKSGETFPKLWEERLKLIATGAGEYPAHTVIRQRYPSTGTEGQVYYELSKDPQIQVVVERWKQIGNVVLEGRIYFDSKYLSMANEMLDQVFNTTTIGGQAGSGDFVVNDAVVHFRPDGGGESTDASIHFNLPGKPGQAPVPMSLDFKTELLSSAGSITILSRVREASEGADVAGVKVDILRARKRSISGLPGEESVLHFASKSEQAEGVRAEWGSPGVASNAFAPQTEMFYSNQDMTGIHEHPDTLLALSYWDSISSSLRFRL